MANPYAREHLGRASVCDRVDGGGIRARVPVSVLDYLDAAAGDELVFDPDRDGVMIRVESDGGGDD